MANEIDLMEFFGTECSHCKSMDPLVARLEDEEGVSVHKLEVWHNEENARLLREYDKGYCGGVPFFYNKRTGKWICGSATYEKLKDWALGT
jgi:thiol-disulfide isomerase/thioredoxin